MRSVRHIVNSLSIKLFVAIVLIMVPLVTMLIIINNYAVHVVRNQVAQSNKNLLTLYMERIDQNLTETDNYLFDLSERNTDVLDLELYGNGDENEYTKAKLRLYNSIRNEISYYPSMDLFFFYSEQRKELITIQKSVSDYNESALVEDEIQRLLQGNVSRYNNTNWYVWQGKQDYYLFHLVKSGNVYVGSWLNVKKLIIPLQYLDFGESGAALVATDQLEPMTHADLVNQEGIQLKRGPKSYYLSGSKETYMVMGESSKKGNFGLFALIPDKAVLEKLPYLHSISGVISGGACVFLLLFLFIIRKVFLKPISRIVSAMRKLRAGNWDTRLNPYRTSTEFEIMNESFNTMIEQIHDLKINVYEEKLKVQKAELKYLQMQINPHFFLNSLNIIYNLATVRDYALIQEMSKCLVAHFRFMFRSRSYFVSLEDELAHTCNYLRIQQLRFPECLTYHTLVQEQLLKVDIPPLIVQIIVENAIKHAVNMDEPLEIDIEVTEVGDIDNRFMIVQVQDTGDGFDETVLKRLQMDEQLNGDGDEHIGIWNVRQRLRLLYQDQASVEFANIHGKGAMVRIRIPMQTTLERSP